VICQIAFLVLYNNVNDPMMSTQAKILFGLNIFTSMMTVVVSLVMLFMKQMLLKQQKDQTSSIDLENIYQDNNSMSMQENPLRERSQNDNVRTENIELKEKVDGLEGKNAGLEGEVTGLKNEVSSLKEQIEMMKADKDVDTVNAL
jgi:cell division protein FtsB